MKKNILTEFVQFPKNKDELFEKAVKIVCQYNRASASLIQRRLSIGYARAARILDQLETAKVISAAEGSKPRDVLIKNADEYLNNNQNNNKKYLKQKTNKEKRKVPLLKTLPSDSLFKKIAQQSNLVNKKFTILLGLKDNKPVFLNLREADNLLIVGSLSSLKEKILDTIIFSLIFQKNSLQTSRFILADSHYDLDLYNKFPHLLTPCIHSFEKLSSAMKWTLMEIERRSNLFVERQTRSFADYNSQVKQPLPIILIIINKVEDFLLSNEEKEVLRLVISKGNKVGIHSVLVTDRLFYKNIPLSIKANIPIRLVFQTSSKKDSFLAGVSGAEKLSPKTEFIFRSGFSKQVKLRSIIVKEKEIDKI